MGYSHILNKDFNGKFAKHGLNGYLEFAGLLNDHWEFGIRLGNQNFLRYSGTAIEINAPTDQNGNIINNSSGNVNLGLVTNLSIMPYARYYVLKIPKIRPYFLVGLGYAYTIAGSGFVELEGTKAEVAVYNGGFVATRAAFGLRLLRVLDLSVGYYYAGRVDKNNRFSSANILTPLKNRYQLHILETQLAFVFGGDLEEKPRSQRKAEKK